MQNDSADAVRLRRKFLGKTDIEIALILEDRLVNAHIQANDYKRVAQEAIETAKEAARAMERNKGSLEEMIKQVRGIGRTKV